jgi:hypothetical protein
LYGEVEQVPPLQPIVVDGDVVSIWISWLFGASALPALSIASHLTVVVEPTENGPV